MKFFFPDSQDLVDPSFDFDTERRSETRVRQRDDLYAHEIFAEPPFDGILVSKGIVDGLSGGTAKYSIAQRQRLMREGVRKFFRIGERPLETIGDCGAFSYVREEEPPFSVDEVLDFYTVCGFDYGISVDHVILGFQADDVAAKSEWVKRQKLTINLANEFFKKSASLRMTPMGVAQGWSAASYAHSVAELQKIGYTRIAMGGMVPLKTPEILRTLEAVNAIRSSGTGLHLLGVTRTEEVLRFQEYGVVSFDSTSPLRQAFKDEKNNYYTEDRTFVALRVPQVEGNPSLRKRIRAGQIDQGEARRLEKGCIQALTDFDSEEATLEETVALLCEYERLVDGRKDRSEVYREVLERRPWRDCKCEICVSLGVHVIMFRGAERNRRRGFHNVWTFRRRLWRALGQNQPTPTTTTLTTKRSVSAAG